MSITFKYFYFGALLVPLTVANLCVAQDQAFGFGRAPTTDELSEADIDVRYDGLGLPSGLGSADEGERTYQAKCAACHGTKLEGNRELYIKPLKGERRHAINNWPFAPPLFGYIRRSMPLTAPGSLTNDEVYGLVAYLLQETGLLDRAAKPLDAASLSLVRMPNRSNFVPTTNSGVILPKVPD